MAQTPDVKPLLTLDTLAVHDQVAIDGVRYDLRKGDELSVVDYQRLAHQLPQLGSLLQREALTPEEEETAQSLLDRVCRTVLVAPDAVHARLTDLHRVSIVTVFAEDFTRLGRTSPGLLMLARATTRQQTPPTRATRRTGATSRRASRGSTAGTRTAG